MNRRGFITMFAVIMVSSIALVVVLSLSLKSLSDSRITNNSEDSKKAFFYAETCLEEALIQVRNSDLVGTNTMTFLDGSCNYDIINTGGETRTVQSTAVVNNSTKKIQAIVNQITTKIILSSWQEVKDF